MMPCARASCVMFVSSFNNVTTITIATALSGGPAFRVAVCFTRHSPTKREGVFVRPYFCLRRILRCYRLLTAIVAVCREKLARYHYLLILPSTGISRSINKGLWIWNENLNERTPFISLRFLETLTMSAHMEGGGYCNGHDVDAWMSWTKRKNLHNWSLRIGTSVIDLVGAIHEYYQSVHPYLNLEWTVASFAQPLDMDVDRAISVLLTFLTLDALDGLTQLRNVLALRTLNLA